MHGGGGTREQKVRCVDFVSRSANRLQVLELPRGRERGACESGVGSRRSTAIDLRSGAEAEQVDSGDIGRGLRIVRMAMDPFVTCPWCQRGVPRVNMLLHELRCAGGKSPKADCTEGQEPPRPTKRTRTASSAPPQSRSEFQSESASSFALLVEMIIHQKNEEYRDRFGGQCAVLTTRANEVCPHDVHGIVAIARGSGADGSAGALAHVLNAGGEAGADAWLSKASCVLRLAEAVAEGSLVLPTFEARPYSCRGDGSDSRFKGELTRLNVTCLANPGRAKLFWIKCGRTDVIAAETDEVRAALALLLGRTSSVRYAIRAKETLSSPKDIRDWFRVNFADELHSEVSALLLRLYNTHDRDASREHDVATAVTKSALEALAKQGRRGGATSVLWSISCTSVPRALRC